MILIFGTSITWGAWDEEGGWAQRIKEFAYQKAFENDFKEYTTVYPLGISGDNTDKLLKRFDTEVQARKQEDDKIHIVIEMGINDSYYFNQENSNAVPLEEYKKNLSELIQKSKHHNADLIFIGLPPVDERVDPVPWRTEISYKMEYVQLYEDALKNICAEQDVPVIEIMSKFLQRDLKTLLSDGVHPSSAGHEIIYNEVRTYLESKNIFR